MDGLFFDHCLKWFFFESFKIGVDNLSENSCQIFAPAICWTLLLPVCPASEVGTAM